MKKDNYYPSLNNIYIGDMTILFIRINNKEVKYTRGFSFIELIVIIAIIAILVAIAVPDCNGYIEKAKKEVCIVNCLELERMYEAYLEMKNIEHTDKGFEKLMQENGKGICPEYGRLVGLMEGLGVVFIQ